MIYERPTELDRALALQSSGHFRILAGGTDFYPARIETPVREPILDLTAIGALRGIEWLPETPPTVRATRPDRFDSATGAWRIGALSTWTDIVRAATSPRLRALVQAAREIGGRQVQNQATVGGNLCNASPAADGAPALAALDAVVELQSVRGSRWLALESFVRGPRRTELAGDEILTAIWIPAASARARSGFSKLGHRRYLVISVAMVAVALDFDASDRLTRVAMAVGSCAPKVVRSSALEQRLTGRLRSEALVELEHALADPGGLAMLSPLTDLRGSAEYRLAAVGELLRRLVSDLVRNDSPQ